jgi:hypothetical protein
MWIGTDVTRSFHDEIYIMWIRADDRGWCHDLIWGDIWIGTDVIGCCLDQIYMAMCIGKSVTSNVHDNFEVSCGLERMILDDDLT